MRVSKILTSPVPAQTLEEDIERLVEERYYLKYLPAGEDRLVFQIEREHILSPISNPNLPVVDIAFTETEEGTRLCIQFLLKKHVRIFWILSAAFVALIQLGLVAACFANGAFHFVVFMPGAMLACGCLLQYVGLRAAANAVLRTICDAL